MRTMVDEDLMKMIIQKIITEHRKRKINDDKAGSKKGKLGRS